MGINTQVDSTTKTFTALLVLGLVGLLFLIVFGNLAGNLGFQRDSTSTDDESGHFINGTTSTLGSADDSNFVSASIVTVNNATDGALIGAGNYTFSSTGTIVGAAGRDANWTTVNISYITKSTSGSEDNTNSVINNLTGGAATFFTFANVWFTLLAVVLLIIIVMSVIGVVQRNQKSSFSQ